MIKVNKGIGKVKGIRKVKVMGTNQGTEERTKEELIMGRKVGVVVITYVSKITKA